MELPDRFILQMQELLGEKSGGFLAAMKQPPAVSIKINRRKTASPDTFGYDGLTKVKWCGSGFYLPERPVFTLNPLIHAGVFYVQDASSMIYETVIEKIAPMALDTGCTLNVLDLCAAPGGKTTSMINALPDGTRVVANEFVGARAAALKENLMKSGEGMMRKEEMAVTQWNEGLQRQCASLQREILDNAFAALRPGGFLIYSTCTFNRLENEENVRYLVEELEMAPVDLDLPDEWGIGKGIATTYPCLRFMPHMTHGEGLFLCVLRKEGDFPVSGIRKGKSLADMLGGKVRIIADGIPLTTTKGRDTVPTTESVLSCSYKRGSLPEAEVDEKTALSYLRHEAIILDREIPKGYVVVIYKDTPLGIVKNLGNRANNLYPAQWRIRMK